MEKIVFATNNEHKLQEIRQILGDSFEVLSLKDIGCEADIPEKGLTLMDNAAQKALYVYNRYHIDCFADDTGLEVDALDGWPGVFSARYAAIDEQTGKETPGASHDSEANMAKLLQKLGENNKRSARFCTVIALVQKMHGMDCIFQVRFFSGIVEGEITRERSGTEGFGYDPIFRPEGYDKTFAELGAEVKNQISHRAIATHKLAKALLKTED